MAKPKKAKTPTQLKKKNKIKSAIWFSGEFVSVFSPFFAIGIINYDKYFIQYDGTKISIGFALAMVVMGVATYLTAKKEFKQSFITILIAWGIVTGILFLIKELLNDLCYIMLFGWFGILGAYGCDIGKKKADKEVAKLQKGIDAAEEQIIRDSYIQEQVEKNYEREIKILDKTTKERNIKF